MTDKLIILSTYVLAVSLATERLVSLIKTIIPWLSTEPVNNNGLLNVDKERLRTLALQVLALICAFITTYMISNFEPSICDEEGVCWKTWLIAILSTAGSAFWKNILDYAQAAKDVKKQERKEMRMKVADHAAQRGVSPEDVSAL